MLSAVCVICMRITLELFMDIEILLSNKTWEKDSQKLCLLPLASNDYGKISELIDVVGKRLISVGPSFLVEIRLPDKS